MSVVTKRKPGRSAVLLVGLFLVSGVVGCSRSDTHADSRPAEPEAASPAAAPATEAPLGESTRSAEATAPAEAAPPVGNSVVQTAQAGTPDVIKAAQPETGAEVADKGAPSLSAEQQELAAEVGDTRHAGGQPSDKAPD